MYKLKTLSVLLFLVLGFFLVSPIYASDIEVWLSPDSGNITSDGNDIDIMVDSYGEEFIGMTVILEFTGPIEFVGYQQGNIQGCEVGRNEEGFGDGEIALYCLIFGDSFVGDSGVFSTITFRATGTGVADIEMVDVDADPWEADFRGGTYSAIFDNGDEGEEVIVNDEEDLPDASISSFSILAIGSGLLFTSFFVARPGNLSNRRKGKTNMRVKISD